MSKKSQSFVNMVVVFIGIFEIVSPSLTYGDKPDVDSVVLKDFKILVKEFSTGETQMRGDKSTIRERSDSKKERVPDKLVYSIVDKLKREGYDAVPFAKHVATKDSKTLILDGSISLISNGSGTARVWIGFGAGSAKLKATVRLYSPENPSAPVLEETLTAKKGGGMFGGGNREDYVNRNFARKVYRILRDMDK